LIYNTCLPHFSLYWKTYALLKPPKTGGFTDKGLSLKIELNDPLKRQRKTKAGRLI
jgi:hypothetical protein